MRRVWPENGLRSRVRLQGCATPAGHVEGYGRAASMVGHVHKSSGLRKYFSEDPKLQELCKARAGGRTGGRVEIIGCPKSSG